MFQKGQLHTTERKKKLLAECNKRQQSRLRFSCSDALLLQWQQYEIKKSSFFSFTELFCMVGYQQGMSMLRERPVGGRDSTPFSCWSFPCTHKYCNGTVATRCTQTWWGSCTATLLAGRLCVCIPCAVRCYGPPPPSHRQKSCACRPDHLLYVLELTSIQGLTKVLKHIYRLFTALFTLLSLILDVSHFEG